MSSKTFYIEHKLGEDWIEYEYEVEFRYTAGTPARISGPPEDCDPGEGAYADDFEGPVPRRRTDTPDAPWETVPFSVFLEGVVESRQFTNDPADKQPAYCRKSALDKARNWVEDELCEAGEDEDRAAYEDAMESRAELAREEGRSRW